MRVNRTIGAAILVTASGLLTLGGCDLVINVGTYCTVGVDPGCGAADTGGTGGTAGTGGMTGGSSTGGIGGATTGGAGGQGGTTSSSGGAGGMPCQVGHTQPCYSGPVDTQSVGPCHAGIQSCQADGSWGPCEGEVTPKPEQCAVAGDEDCNFGVGCSETVWNRIAGDASLQYLKALAYDLSGNLYAVGQFDGTIDFGGEPLISSDKDVFVVKLDTMGNRLWSRRYGDSALQNASDVAVDSDGNVVVVGYFSGKMNVDQTMLSAVGGNDVFVLKLDSSGNKVWARQFGDSGVAQAANSVAIDPGTGEIVIAGDFDGTLDFDGKVISTGGQQDAFLAKLSKDGTGSWARGFGDASTQYGWSASLDSSGNIFMTGQFSGAMNFGAGTSVANGTGDAYLARFDADGNASWAKKMTAFSSAQPTGLAVDSAGDVVLAIETNGAIDVGDGSIPLSTSDVILAKYSSGGVFQWKKQLGGAGEEYGPNLVTDAEKRLILSFYSDASVNLGAGDLPSGGGYDIVVAGLEPNGDLRWAKRFGGAGDQSSPRLAVGPKGQIAVGCLAGGTINFGLQDLTSQGNDVALAEFGPN